MTTTPTELTKPVAPLSVPPLPVDLDAGLRRLKLAAIRRSAPEVLLTAKTKRRTPEEVLRTLVETELAARDASKVVNRLKAAGFPVAKTLESFDVAASSIQPKIFDYLSSLEWIRAQQNLAIIGPAGTGKSHTLRTRTVAMPTSGVKYLVATSAPRAPGRLNQQVRLTSLVTIDRRPSHTAASLLISAVAPRFVIHPFTTQQAASAATASQGRDAGTWLSG
jgi:ABC-type glutathione transport system ATPase component